MECTFSAATAAAASVSTVSVTAERAGALHGFAEVYADTSMTCTFMTVRRREGGIWNLVKLEVSLEERLGYCLATHHAIDRHVLRQHFLIVFVMFSFLRLWLETHVGMRACMQCTCKHGLICLNLDGGCRM